MLKSICFLGLLLISASAWAQPPTITSFTPTSAGSGMTVTITGTNFTGATAVRFGGLPASSFIVVSATSITAIVGSGFGGNVTVTTPFGTATRAGFNFFSTPTITSFTPTSAGAGASVIITGTNLSVVSALSFGGTAASTYFPDVLLGTTVTAVVANGASGSVSVTTPGGIATLPGFTFIPPPTISSFSPTTGATGRTITITGTNLTTTTAVSFGGTPASSFNVVSDNSITAVVVGGSPGNISVTTLGGTATRPGFLFAPTITSFTPSAASTGTTVTITGIDFTGVTGVRFGFTPASSFNVVSTTSITAVVAGGASGSVLVTTLSASASLAGFTFTGPTITSFTPTAAVGGATVTITGTNFTGATAVSFGGTAASSFSVASATSITAVVAGGTSGNVSVTTPGGTATQAGFTFIPPPTVTSFTPTAAGSGATITITGTNFNPTAINNIVFFGATRAVVSAATTTQLTVTVPTGATYAPISVLDATTGLLAYSVANFTPTFAPIKGSITAIDFEPKVDFAIAAQVVWSEIGDLDGDGKADLAIINNPISNPNTVSVLRNTGTIGTANFAPKVDFGTGVAPAYFAIGDLDGDGKLDLAVTNRQDNTISILRNTSSIGTVSFATKLDFGTGTEPNFVAIGDLDGDGKADLAIANSISGTVSILRNTSSSGSISFASKVDFATPVVPRGIAIGDLDGDGKGDVATANWGNANVSVFRNTSSGVGVVNFAPKVDFAIGTNPFSVAIGDLDGDGKADLAVENNGSNTISVLRNTGTIGTVNFARTDFTVGNGPFGLAMGDLDGDSKPDLAVANLNDASVSVLRSTSSSGLISFVAKLDFTTGAIPRSANIADIDGDGKPDLSTLNSTGNTLSFIRNNPVFPPTITSFTPTSTASGATVTITGTNFTGATAVSFGGTAASSFSVASATSITAVVSGGASGNVSVTTPGGTATRVGFTFIPAPIIASFTPTSAASGATITITGANFTGATAVSFGGTAASSFTVASATSITAVVAGGASGNVSVTTPGGTATQAGFIFIPAPTIISFTPTSAASGATVTITGANFTGATAVSFGGTPAASFTVASATSITAVVAGGASGNVLVTTPGGTATQAGFTFIPAPTIASFTPTSAASGATVTITGTNFTGATAVSFGGTAASSFNVVSATSITAVVAGGTSGSVSVTTPGGTATQAGFIFIPAPTITSFTPTSAASGATVTITGTNFIGATAVSFGGTAASSFTVASATSITTVIASGASGSVSVTTPGGTATQAGFIFIPAPTITSFTPTSAASGATVTITGTNFTGATAVSFGGTAASSFTVASATTITAVVASGASGSVSVTTPGGTATQAGFTFIPAPTITSFTPTSAASGATVTITGTNFTGATAVSFGGTAASSFNVVSATSITAVIAGGASGSVSVTTPGGTATQAGFTFIPAPTITSFTPTSAASGTTVTITGTNFTGATAVSFGGTAASSFNVVSATSITAVVAAGASGSVSVTTPGGTATQVGFTFIPAPTITSFTPPSAASGATVTITGTNFTGATAVSFGGTAASSFTVASATSITAVVASGASGSVAVTTPAGMASLAGFTFTAAAQPLVKVGNSPSGTVVINGQSSAINAGTTPQFNDLTKEFIIENPNSFPLAVQSITFSNSKFSIVQAPQTIAPGAFAPLVIRLEASDVGMFSAKISIQFDLTTYEFNVAGEVLSEKIVVFNVVTPNGDGAHDFLKISNIEFYPGNKVYLFDRWGEKVFEVAGYDNSNPLKRFDGTSTVRNRPLDEGTYFYVIETERTTRITGFIQLSR